MTNKILEKAIGIKDQLVSDRRALHRIPEFGVSTPKTAAYVTARLNEMGIPNRHCGVHRPEDREIAVLSGCPDAPDSTGVVGLIGKSGPCFMLRADMDGLPIAANTH